MNSVAAMLLTLATLSIVIASGQPYPPPSNPFCGSAAGPINLFCRNGVISSIVAFYGLPVLSSCTNLTAGPCHYDGFQALANFTCLGKQSCSLTPCCGDPCPEHAKSIAVSATCSVGPGGWPGPSVSTIECVGLAHGAAATPASACSLGICCTGRNNRDTLWPNILFECR